MSGQKVYFEIISRKLLVCIRVLCFVKSSAAISLSGRCDNPPLVLRVLLHAMSTRLPLTLIRLISYSIMLTN